MDRTIGDNMDNKDIEVFGGKSLSDLLKDIYDNSVEKKTQIKTKVKKKNFLF